MKRWRNKKQVREEPQEEGDGSILQFIHALPTRDAERLRSSPPRRGAKVSVDAEGEILSNEASMSILLQPDPVLELSDEVVDDGPFGLIHSRQWIALGFLFFRDHPMACFC